MAGEWGRRISQDDLTVRRVMQHEEVKVFCFFLGRKEESFLSEEMT
jgi:hypothetical protein